MPRSPRSDLKVTDIRQMMSLILLAVGGLMALLGAAGLLARAPAGAGEPNGVSTFRVVLVVVGVVGAGLIALGVRVRAVPAGKGVVTWLWVGYGLFWLFLTPLLVFVAGDVVRIGAAPEQHGRPLAGLLLTLGVLGGPAIGWVQRRLKSRPAGPPPNDPAG